ncbi:MAG: OmpW family protein [Archangiaceae bacterium]|nr:OmpW family protein [Archangiaceae bacterium]
MRALAFMVVVVASSAARAAEDAVAAPVDAAPVAVDASRLFGTGLFLRVGGLVIAPAASSSEVSLQNVVGPARLSVSDGPIPGSGVGLSPAYMPAAILGWTLPWLGRRLSIETVLAAPFTLKMTTRGSLTDKSLAPYALGNLPTGVPALGSELGEAKVLPPVLTATWRFGPLWRLQPYLGLGVSYLITLEARITNPVLTEVATPTMEVPNALGFVVQGGLDFRIWRWLYATVDLKYIAGLELTARVKNLWVRLPRLPLYEAARVGDNEVHVTVNPFVLSAGVGANF